MEPNDLNSPTSPEDVRLETWLRTHASLPPLPDDGFSRRVLATLPPPARPRATLRLFICVGAATAGVVIAAWPLFAAGNPLDRLPALDAVLVKSVEQLASPAIGMALSATLASLVFVFWSDLRRFVRL